ncbi:5'/3'-nucleotidase SurE [Candidatus Latescibacterota bacterium]
MDSPVLLTNDDGINAPGIQALREAVSPRWPTVLVAPDREQSASSHALTLNRPLRANQIDAMTIAVDGTPTDCVMLAFKGLLETRPAFVISGINNGANLGDDVIYSGTVAAAAEATVLGVPAVAVSLVEPEVTDLAWCSQMTASIVEKVMHQTMPKGVFLNVNFPPRWTGGTFEVTTLGSRSYRDVIIEKNDPRGRPYYWIGGHVNEWIGGESCDFASIARGNISITPLYLDMTAIHVLDEIRSWSFE